MTAFPILIGEIEKRDIKRRDIAKSLSISEKALQNKLKGRTTFSWPEAQTIHRKFFPDVPINILFGDINDLLAE